MDPRVKPAGDKKIAHVLLVAVLDPCNTMT